MRGDGLLKCARHCISRDLVCPIKECSHNIDYYEDNNCVLVAVFKNGRMTLRETAMRLDISFARVKQLQDRALKKLNSDPDLQWFKF
jgi:hypothetical protein|tara:strand:+ start:577 stop:837 length:261 start_codon:yes stop_codon:yes gene_type:complete